MYCRGDFTHDIVSVVFVDCDNWFSCIVEMFYKWWYIEYIDSITFDEKNDTNSLYCFILLFLQSSLGIVLIAVSPFVDTILLLVVFCV